MNNWLNNLFTIILIFIKMGLLIKLIKMEYSKWLLRQRLDSNALFGSILQIDNIWFSIFIF